MAADRHSTGNDIPRLEWAAAIVGLVLVCGALAMMISQSIVRADAPADISVRVEAVTPVREGYVVTIRAVNSGGTTAADVTVEGELRNASGVAETTSMSFKYVPPDSQRRGGLIFEKDPRQFELKVRPKGYETP